MRIAARNYQGIKKSPTTRALRAMMKSINPHVVFLSETKCHGDECLKKLGLRKGWKIKAVDSIGLIRGLIILWKNDIDVRVSELNPKFISAKIKEDVVNLF